MIVTYIFLLIFSFQVFPVKQLGQLLYKMQMTEELYDADGKADENEPEKQVLSSCNKLHIIYISKSQYYNHIISIAIHFTEIIPASYVSDLFSPPPNLQV